MNLYKFDILKNKPHYPEEFHDIYNFINSKTIGNYCREIEHKFNTEELAVLIYKNKRMSVDEKIKEYDNLIKNYPDMEVIERINCDHYDSVKDMIKEEITRLKMLRKKLVANSKTPFSEGHVLEYDRFPFVLEYLITWDNNFATKLNEGNFDSSDMQG